MKRFFLTVVIMLAAPVAVFLGLVACIATRAPVAPTLAVDPVEDPFEAAREALAMEDPLLAIAYLEQVSEHSYRYPRAQRMIAYDLYTVRLGRPAEGIRYALRALQTDPENENSWTDAGRVVWSALEVHEASAEGN